MTKLKKLTYKEEKLKKLTYSKEDKKWFEMIEKLHKKISKLSDENLKLKKELIEYKIKEQFKSDVDFSNN